MLLTGEILLQGKKIRDFICFEAKYLGNAESPPETEEAGTERSSGWDNNSCLQLLQPPYLVGKKGWGIPGGRGGCP
jgi:hypothetical protein